MKVKTEQAIEQIGRYVERINKQMEIIKSEFPDAMIYLEDCGNFNIMSANSHDDNGDANHDAVLECFDLADASGGGW